MTATARLLFSLRNYKLHPLAAIAAGGYVVGFAFLRAQRRREPWVLRWAIGALLLAPLQLAAGLLNAALQAPTWMQTVNLLLADLLWAAIVLLAAASAERQP